MTAQQERKMWVGILFIVGLLAVIAAEIFCLGVETFIK